MYAAVRWGFSLIIIGLTKRFYEKFSAKNLMLASDKSPAAKTAPNPLPPKLAALLRESWWLAFLAVALYLLLVLLSFHKGDPGWSHSVTTDRLGNAGGLVGAYVADLLLFMFGISAYWWVALCAALVLWSFRRIETVTETDRRSHAVMLIGFVVLLVASCGIESLRLYTLQAELPGGPGGALGAMVGNGLATVAGFTGGTLLLLVLLALNDRQP